MKSCQQYREEARLILVETPKLTPSESLLKHRQLCPACDQYWQDLDQTCAALFVDARNFPAITAGDAFHSRLRTRIATAETPVRSVHTFLGVLSALRRQLGWKTVYIASAVCVIVAFAVTTREQAQTPEHTPRGIVRSVPSTPVKDSRPTLAAYRAIASRSFDELDAVLAKDSNRLLPVDPEPPTRLGDVLHLASNGR
jgi:hypothetical protein